MLKSGSRRCECVCGDEVSHLILFGQQQQTLRRAAEETDVFLRSL